MILHAQDAAKESQTHPSNAGFHRKSMEKNSTKWNAKMHSLPCETYLTLAVRKHHLDYYIYVCNRTVD